MPTTQERIEASKIALEEAQKAYDDGKQQYDKSLALYEQAKAAAAQAKAFATSIGDTKVDALTALKTAASFAPDPRVYSAQINQPGANIQEIQKQQLNEATKKLNIAEKIRRQAEKEVQQAEKVINGFKNRINVLRNQLGIVIGGISLKKKAETEKKISTKKIKQRGIKIKRNNIRALIKKNKAAIKALAKAAALYVIARLLNRQLQQLSKTVQQLTELVDSVNDQIESIQTKQDVQKARVTRDAALVELNKAERQITVVRNTIKTLETIATVLSLLLSVALLIPIPPFAPAKVTEKMINAKLTLDAITILLGINRQALDDLIAEVQYQRSRLLPISDIIDQAIDNNLTPEEISNLLGRLGNLGQLGPIAGISYRGFTFAIYEEEDPRFVVAGNKRRYAVALDRSGFITLKSQSSFTLDPDVLIEELKLQIDEQNLEA
jgi:hypothetical protein